MNRTPLILLSAAALAAAAPTAATGTDVAGVPACDRTTWSASDFPPGSTVTVSVEAPALGLAFGPLTVPFDRATSIDLPTPGLIGRGDVEISGYIAWTTPTRSRTRTRAFGPVTLNCPAAPAAPTPAPAPPSAPAPAPAPAPASAPGPAPTTQVLLTCADLRARGAGIRWLRALRCVPAPRPRVTCLDIPKGAGRSWYVRLQCPLPGSYIRVNPRPAVTGERA